MTRLQYRVREMFATLQGEGAWSGHRAVFVRFTGCNIWSGHEKDRERDAAKGVCAAWCDTEFRDTAGPGGGVFTARELAERARELWGADGIQPEGDRMVVLTGGEPSLQVDSALVAALHAQSFRVHIETNGSRAVPDSIDWVTLSPKPPMPVHLVGEADEVKVVLAPGIDPAAYAMHTSGPCWVQPCDYGKGDPRTVDSIAQATRYVMEHPGWRLGVQLHKVVGLP
jgi:7-carboxy-7-deazaguanine synthase